MAILTSNIVFALSVTTGSAGNTVAQGNVNASLGTYISTTTITNNSLNNLFSDITGDENATLQTDYRCIFIYNNSSTNSFLTPFIWLSGQRFTTTHASTLFNITSHGYIAGDTVRMDAELSTDTLPTGYNNSTTYYVISPTTNTFELSLTSGGSAVSMSADGTGAIRRYGPTVVTFAVDNVGAVAVGSSSAQATNIATTTTAPTAVGSFSAPTTKATGIALGTIPAGDCIAIWVKRVATNSAVLNNDMAVIGVQGDTTA
jgi:hypothetical protein